MTSSVRSTTSDAFCYEQQDEQFFNRVFTNVLSLDDPREGLFRDPVGESNQNFRARTSVLPIPFNNDPRPVVRYLLSKLVEALEEPSLKDRLVQWKTVDFPVPIALPLAVPYNERLDVVNQIRRGVDWVRGQLGSRQSSLVREDVLANAVDVLPHKLLLIVFHFPSYRLLYDAGKEEGKTECELIRIKRLHEYVHRYPDRQPHVLFVASDLHHANFIESVWGDPVASFGE